MGSKLEAENNKDTVDTLVEALKGSAPDENDSKSGERVQLLDIQEPLLQPVSRAESDDSEMEVEVPISKKEKVQVCNICGNAGQENLLAICSKCDDGAEHTYCMQEMLQEVPEGDWLCEECQLENEAETQKKESDDERIEETRVALRAQTYGKRHAENVEGAHAVKMQAIETGMRLLKLSHPSEVAVPSRYSSFKRLDMEKIALSRESFGNHCNKDILEATWYPTTGPPRPQTKGILKSRFSGMTYKRRVKLVDFVGSANKIGTKEHPFSREPSAKKLGQSMSFRSTEVVGHSRSGNSKVMHPSKFSHAEELKRLKQVKEGKGYKREVSSKLDDSIKSATIAGLTLPIIKADEKLTPRGGSGSGSVSTVYNRELKVSQLDTKLASSANSACHLAQNAVEKPVAQSCREEIDDANKFKATIEAALHKIGFTRNRGTNQSDGGSVSRADMNSEKASLGQSSIAQKLKNATCIDGAPGLTNLLTSGSSKQMTTNHRKSLHSADVKRRSEFGYLDIDSLLPAKQPTTDWHSRSAMSLAIPEPVCIWKGSFELDRGQKLPELQSGFRAYLSNLVSGKVVKMVNKLSEIVALREVPRLTIWPTRFHVSGAKDENIALFFFAEDLESYEKRYKGLVDNMVKYDLALEGNFDGIKLLIFASNQLRKNRQRWNSVYFLWGVFLARKVNDSNPRAVESSKIP